MVKSELDMLQSFIDELSGALSASPQDEECLYDLLNRANALYGDYVPEIAEQREEIMQFHGLLSRNCNAILALLKRELIKQTDNFEAGIMPLTYSQLSVCPAAQTVYKSGIIWTYADVSGFTDEKAGWRRDSGRKDGISYHEKDRTDSSSKTQAQWNHKG